MNELLEIYRELRSPDAQRWNLSPQSLYIEYHLRKFIGDKVEKNTCKSICNVGIGAGEWDDFLGYWIEGYGQVTSIDCDTEICHKFKIRQKFENHPNPSRIINADINDIELFQASFDIITVIGSTLNETGDYNQTLSNCLRLLKSTGKIMYSDFHRFNKPEQFVDFARTNQVTIREQIEYCEIKDSGFYIFLGIK